MAKDESSTEAQSSKERARPTNGVLQVFRGIAIRTPADDVPSRLVTKMKCPKADDKQGNDLDCDAILKEWQCLSCRQVVKFTVDGWCICKCGYYPFRGTRVRCNSGRHIFLERTSISVPDEYYHVAVFSSSSALLEKFLSVVSDGAGTLRHKQQIVHFINFAGQEVEVKKIQAICIVVAKQGNGDQPVSLKSELLEVKYLIGQQSLKNVIVCCEGELPEELWLKEEEPIYRPLELTEDLKIPTFRFGSDNQFVHKFVRMVCSCKPIYLLNAGRRDSSEKLSERGENMKKICGFLRRAIEINLKSAAEAGGPKKKAVLYTTRSNPQSNRIPDLAGIEKVPLVDQDNGAWTCEILLIDSSGPDSLALLKREHEDLTDFERRMVQKVHLNENIKEQRRELASICSYLVESRYCQEIAEYLDATDNAIRTVVPKDVATLSEKLEP